ncbi:MAG: PASTA domain-containing protein, partial [Bacteroidota bacterium]
HPVEMTFQELGEKLDFGFIALHGRPGEDGHLQQFFEQNDIPYNGSGVESSSITINKYETLQKLKQNGFSVTDQFLINQDGFKDDPNDFLDDIERKLSYPFIAKPVDDGCSSAVKVLRNRDELKAYVQLMFRKTDATSDFQRKILKLRPKEEFPRKQRILFEKLITADGAKHFLEITGGLLTHYKPDGTVFYEVFEPSETLATGDVLSLEEKFLAGEGQNITPARFADNLQDYNYIAQQVKEDLQQVARKLKVEGYARIDAFIRIFEDNSIETIVVEVNSLPGMTPATCIFHQAAINEYKPYDFIEKIIEYGKQRFVQRVSKQEMEAEQALVAEQVGEEMEEVELTEIQEVPEATIVEKNILEEEVKAKEELKEKVSIQKKIKEEENKKPSFFLSTWLSILAFIRSPYFLKNLALWGGFLLLFFFLLNKSLDWYTRHGEAMEVENFEGMTLATAKQLAKDRNLKLVVIDSTFNVRRRPGVVIMQTPKAGSIVKRKRSIYIEITKVIPDFVQLPSLVGSDDYQQYINKLNRIDIEATIREKVYNPKYEENTILHFYFEGEKVTMNDIEDGYKVPRGSTLEFVVTERNNGKVNIPNLVCKQYKEVGFIIDNYNLSLGTVEGSRTDNAFVYKQEPAFQPGVQIPMGAQIKIYLTANRPQGCGGSGGDQANDTEEQF